MSRIYCHHMKPDEGRDCKECEAERRARVQREREAKAARCGKRPGHEWRAQGDRDGFDELAIDHWFHLERMSKRHYWLRVGDYAFGITVEKSGHVVVVQSDGPEPPKAKSRKRSTR